MTDKIRFLIGLALTVPLNVGFPYAMKFLSELDWWFFIYAVIAVLPLGILSVLAGVLLHKSVPWPPGRLLGCYLVLTSLNFTAWGLYSLYKAATLQWFGH
jgi:hypothetical protein